MAPDQDQPQQATLNQNVEATEAYLQERINELTKSLAYASDRVARCEALTKRRFFMKKPSGKRAKMLQRMLQAKKDVERHTEALGYVHKRLTTLYTGR